MKKTTLLTISMTLLMVLPTTAQLGAVWSDFQSYAGDLQTYLANNLTDTLKPIEPEAQSAINNATGALNIPNPITTEKSIRDSMIWYYVSDKFDNNPTVRANLAGHEINRLITRSAVASALGADGQIRWKTKLENIEESVKKIAGLTSETEPLEGQLENLKNQALANIGQATGAANFLSSFLGLTQLQSVKIQQEQSKMMAEMLGQTMQTNQFLLYSNLNLANISQQIEESNRARRVDTSAEAARLLRTAAQSDLFGRELEK
jgi:hypothetical protein